MPRDDKRAQSGVQAAAGQPAHRRGKLRQFVLWIVGGLVLATLAGSSLVWGLSQPSLQSRSDAAPPSHSLGGAASSPVPSAGPSSGAPHAAASGKPTPGGPPVSGQPSPATPAADEARLATIDQPTSAPVPLNGEAKIAEDIAARITHITAVQGEAQGIGEIAGPAIRFTIAVTNGTGQPINLSNAVVNVAYGPNETPSSGLSGPNTAPFPTTNVEAGTTATGSFVFAVPLEQRDSVRIYLNYSAAAPIAVFSGPTPRQ